MEIDGLPVIDANDVLWIDVQNRDLIATRKNPKNCVIARASKRELKADEVRVHLSRIYVKKNNQWTRYITPKNLRTELIAFDRGGDFMPGDYAIAPPQPHRRTGKRQGSATNEKTINKARLPYHKTENVRLSIRDKR